MAIPESVPQCGKSSTHSWMPGAVPGDCERCVCDRETLRAGCCETGPFDEMCYCVDKDISDQDAGVAVRFCMSSSQIALSQSCYVLRCAAYTPPSKAHTGACA